MSIQTITLLCMAIITAIAITSAFGWRKKWMKARHGYDEYTRIADKRAVAIQSLEKKIIEQDRRSVEYLQAADGWKQKAEWAHESRQEYVSMLAEMIQRDWVMRKGFPKATDFFIEHMPTFAVTDVVGIGTTPEEAFKDALQGFPTIHKETAPEEVANLACQEDAEQQRAAS